MSQFEQDIDAFIRASKDEHLVVYLPYSGWDLLEFLDSCFHRRFIAYIVAQGLIEVALFSKHLASDIQSNLSHTESRFAILLSRSLKSFDAEDARNFHASGALEVVFGIRVKTPLSCYLFLSNTLVTEQTDFYLPGDRNERRLGISSTDATWFAAYLSIRDGYFDTRTRYVLDNLEYSVAFQTQPQKHKCWTKTWCNLEKAQKQPPSWSTVFSPPWDRPQFGISDMYPYRVLPVSISCLKYRYLSDEQEQPQSNVNISRNPFDRLARQPPPSLSLTTKAETAQQNKYKGADSHPILNKAVHEESHSRSETGNLVKSFRHINHWNNTEPHRHDTIGSPDLLQGIESLLTNPKHSSAEDECVMWPDPIVEAKKSGSQELNLQSTRRLGFSVSPKHLQKFTIRNSAKDAALSESESKSVVAASRTKVADVKPDQTSPKLLAPRGLMHGRVESTRDSLASLDEQLIYQASKSTGSESGGKNGGASNNREEEDERQSSKKGKKKKKREYHKELRARKRNQSTEDDIPDSKP